MIFTRAKHISKEDESGSLSLHSHKWTNLQKFSQRKTCHFSVSFLLSSVFDYLFSRGGGGGWEGVEGG